MKRTTMTRDEQEQWAVEYLAGNLSKEEVADAECSITVQAFADFFAAQWPRTFNKMHFAARVRQQAQMSVRQGIGYKTYKLDDATFDHLTMWCERESRDADEMLELRGKMIDFVQSLPVEDAEYSVGHGWSHVRNLMEG